MATAKTNLAVEFTPEEIEAMGEALYLARDDQGSYLALGNMQADYGDDWPEEAERKAKAFRLIGGAAAKLGLENEQDRWNELAENVGETVKPDGESDEDPEDEEQPGDMDEQADELETKA